MPNLALPDRVALVTGAARGIGLETARALAQRGMSVVLLDRNQFDVDRAANDIGGSVLAIAADVTDRTCDEGGGAAGR